MPGLRACAATAALAMTATLGLALPAQATSQQAPSASADSSAAGGTDQPGATSAVKDSTIDVKHDTVAAAPDLKITATVRGNAGSHVTVQLRRAQNQEAVADTEAKATIGADGTATVAIPAGAVEPGTYVVTSADQTKQSDKFTIEPGSSAQPSESGTPTPSDTASASASAKPKVGTQDEKDQARDEYYPELAKKLYKQDDGTYKIPAPTPGGTSAGNVPAGLGSYYGQKVDFSSANCTALDLPTYEDKIGRKAECGYVIAPIDAKNPKAGNIAIAVLKVAAGKVTKDADGKITGFTPNKHPKGSVLWNPGGPGGSGTTLALVGARDESDLAADYDMIGFDPRGTGESLPFSECSTDKQQDDDRASNPWGKDRADAEDELNKQAERTTKDCFKRTGELFNLGEKGQLNLMKHLGTWDAVGDVDLIRSVAGDAKLNYIGFSYGTRLGYVYAQKFQANAGKLVLDGVVDPGDADALKALKAINAKAGTDTDPAFKSAAGKPAEYAAADSADDEQDDNIKQGAGFQGTFEEFALDCSAKGKRGVTWGEAYPGVFDGSDLENEKFTCPLGDGITDRDALTSANAKLLQTLEKKPLPTGLDGDDRQVTFADGRQGVFEALYSESYWGYLANGLAELKAGKSAGMLMQLADQYASRDDTGHYDPMLQAFTNIRCTDENSYGNKPDIEKLRKYAEAYDKAAPFQAGSISPGVYDYCDFWKFKGTLPKAQKLTKVPNVLVVSTTHDSATPYPAGVKVARLIDGTLLSASGASHTSYMSGDEEKACVDDIVNDFFVKGQVPADGEYGKKLAKPDTAKDDKGKTVTLRHRCKVETFRNADFTTSAQKVHAGEKFLYQVKHLDSQAKYSIRLSRGTATSRGVSATAAKSGAKLASFTTDNGGNAVGQLRTPKGTDPGSYRVQVVNADGKVVASQPLRVLKKSESKPGPKPGGDVNPGGNGGNGGNGNGGGGSSDGSMPDTGYDPTSAVIAALLLLLAGGATVALVRRRRMKSED